MKSIGNCVNSATPASSPAVVNSEFFTNGFQVFELPDLAAQLDLDRVVWRYEGGVDGDNHPVDSDGFLGTALYSLHQQITLQIIEPSFGDFEIDKRRLWEGVNKNASKWHNDGAEGPNCFFLLYFSDMSAVGEGAIWFKCQDKEWKIHPKYGTLIAVNCESQFLHRAEQTKHTRILAGFCYNVDFNSYFGN